MKRRIRKLAGSGLKTVNQTEKTKRTKGLQVGFQKLIRKQIRRQGLFTLLMAAVLCVLLSYGIARALFPYRPQFEPVPMYGDWITTEEEGGYSGTFRKHVYLKANVRRAWIQMAAKDGYELLVNGDSASRFYLWRPTRPVQNGLSEKGQRLSNEPALLAVNFPREYQWEGHRNYLIPTFVDLTHMLKRGNNVLTWNIESRRLPTSIWYQGEIELWTGEVIKIRSDETTLSVRMPEKDKNLHWSHRNYPDNLWPQSVVLGKGDETLLQRLNPDMYRKDFNAYWIRSPNVEKENRIVFEKEIYLEEEPSDIWIRMMANRKYDLFVNGSRANSTAFGKDDLSAGDWVMGNQKTVGVDVKPNNMDPDEIGSLFAGQEFLSPRVSSQEDLDYNMEVGNNEFEAGYEATLGGESGGPQGYDFGGGVSAPSHRVPGSLRRNRQRENFDGYTLTDLFKKGHNTIQIQLNPSSHLLSLTWEPQIALDGEATLESGKKVAFLTDETWRTHLAGEEESKPVLMWRRAHPQGAKLPKLEYKGYFYNLSEKMDKWLTVFGLTCGTIIGGLLLALYYSKPATKALFTNKILNDKEIEESSFYIGRIAQILILPTALVFSFVLVQYSIAERHETLPFYTGTVWVPLIVITVTLTIFAIVALSLLSKRVLQFESAVYTFIEALPTKRIWPFIIFWLVLLTFFLRAYELDFQTIDDDEYASIQAVIAISEKGGPQYTEDVYYTRSPFYHYLCGAIVWLFGVDIWTLRLPACLFGGATAWLVYMCGARLLHSRWIGMGALILFAVHPFFIFTSHIARFYQQQQFFALATVYCFCLGFVEQKNKYRLWCLMMYLSAILSQETSLVMGFQIAFAYLLFAEKKKWQDEVRMIIVAACVVGLTAVNLMVFQTRCMTKLEGISPNVEATLGLNFKSPINFMAIFFCYSRLHLGHSLLFFMGLPYAFRDQNRNILAMYFLMLSGIFFLNVLVTGVSLRYQYWLIPIWIVLGLYGLKSLLAAIELSVRQPNVQNRLHLIYPICAVVVFTAIVISWSPQRIINSYDTKILGDATSAFQYVRTNLREGDAVAGTEPHPHAGLLETGRIDYDLSFPLLYDFTYRKDGVLIDRNGGATVVPNVHKLNEVCAKHQRVWFLINREKFKSRGKNIRWSYPGARAEHFLRTNCEVKFQSYLWTVFLWDSSKGQYQTFKGNYNYSVN